MNGCACPHSVSEHGSPKQFGQHLCLVSGCHCNGTHEEVIEAYVARSMAKKRIVHDVTDAVREVLSHGNLPRATDELALEIATAICGRWALEAK